MADQNLASIDRLSKVLGYDPARQTGTGEVFQAALKEIQEDRDKAVKEKAKALLTQAIDLRCKMDEARRQFTSQEKKFDKELKKLLGRIEGFAKGESPAAIEEREKEEAEKEKGGSEESGS